VAYLGDLPRSAGKGRQKVKQGTTGSLTGPGPHNIASGLKEVAYGDVTPRDAAVAPYVTWSGATITFYSNATATQSVDYNWFAVGKAR